MRSLFCLCLCMLVLRLSPQNADPSSMLQQVTLQQCREWTRSHYPLSQQADILNDASKLRTLNLGKSWYPQLALNGQASYQSEVTSLPITIPGITIPELNKDFWKLSLDVNQTLYDGGQTSAMKKAEAAGLRADQQSLKVELNRLNEKVNQVYFNILLMQVSLELYDNVRSELNSRLRKAEAALRNNAGLEVQVNILKTEILKTEQQITEARAGLKASLDMLSLMTGQTFSDSVRLEVPDSRLPESLELRRPEMEWYDLQSEKLEAGKRLSSSRLLPRVSLFAQAGYGRPGLNMLDPDFSDWYMGGIRVSWSIWNWNSSANEKKIINLQKDLLQTQKESFEQNTRIQLSKDYQDIRKLDEMIARDQEIVALRGKIAETFSVQYEQGIITATEYTTELNAGVQAKISLEMHRLQQKLAIENYLFNSGLIQ